MKMYRGLTVDHDGRVNVLQLRTHGPPCGTPTRCAVTCAGTAHRVEYQRALWLPTSDERAPCPADMVCKGKTKPKKGRQALAIACESTHSACRGRPRAQTALLVLMIHVTTTRKKKLSCSGQLSPHRCPGVCTDDTWRGRGSPVLANNISDSRGFTPYRFY